MIGCIPAFITSNSKSAGVSTITNLLASREDLFQRPGVRPSSVAATSGYGARTKFLGRLD